MSESDDYFDKKSARLAEQEKQLRAEIEQRQQLWGKISLWLGVLGAVASVIIGSSSFFFGSRPSVAPESPYLREITELKTSLVGLQSRLDVLDARFKQLAATPTGAADAQNAAMRGDESTFNSVTATGG